MLIGGEIVDEPVRMDTINADMGFVAVKGRVFKLETKPIRNNSRIAILYITDETYSVAAKFFFEPEDDAFVEKHFAAGSHLILYGDIAYDKYSKELSLLIRNASSYKPEKRVDHAEKKRVELHLHTTLSALDALTRPKELIKRVTEWGHSAIAITDHGVVQAYPDVFNAAKDLKSDIKIIYGIECYLTDFPEEEEEDRSVEENGHDPPRFQTDRQEGDGEGRQTERGDESQQDGGREAPPRLPVEDREDDPGQAETPDTGRQNPGHLPAGDPGHVRPRQTRQQTDDSSDPFSHPFTHRLSPFSK